MPPEKSTSFPLRLRVAHIVSAISEEASGPTYVVTRLCDSLIECGHDVTLATLDWAPMQRSPVYHRDFPLGIGPKKLGRSPAMKQWLVEKASIREFDVIHSHGLWMMTNIYPGQVAAKYNLVYMVSPHGAFTKYAMRTGSAIKPLFWSWLQRPSLEAVLCFHALSEHEYNDIRRLGFDQPVAIIQNGVDIPPRAKPLKQHQTLRTLLYLGRVHPEKGLDSLLYAWRTLQNRFADWRLRVVGPDINGYLSEVKELARRLDCQRVEFIGPLFGEQKWQAYIDADLYVLSSPSEGLPMTVLESLACGTPVIVSKGTPFAGVETHGAGWWVDIDVESLVSGLEKALACSTDQLHIMGLRGRAWMERDFLWQRIGEQMAETYRWLCDHSIPKPPWVRVD